MSRIKYVSQAGVFQRAFEAINQDTVDAAQAAIAEAGEIAKQKARADIVASGLGTKFANALRLNIYPKGGRKSINARAQIFHKIPYAGVFEEGATIRGKPTLWVALPTAPQRVAREQMTPKVFAARIGPLFELKRVGKLPLLMARAKIGGGKSKGKITVPRLRAARTSNKGTRAVPIFVGLPSVSIRRRLNIRAIVARARDQLPAIFAAKFKA